jgi:hypothetical protein
MVDVVSDRPVRLEEWRELYSAAEEFRRAGCWSRMWDSDVFGIKNPVDGEVGYCCVMGHGGEHFGLGVYLGTQGLQGILKMQSGDLPSNAIDMLQVQDCLMASFEDRKLLWPEDLEVIRSLGLKFRGANAWPLFRSYRPGYVPWFLTGEEARFLTLALGQAIDVSNRFANDPDMLDPPDVDADLYFVRVPEKDGVRLEWRDDWLEPVPMERAKLVGEHVDAARLEELARRKLPRRGSCEIGSFLAPQPVKEGSERPFFPVMTLFVERGSGMIRNYRMERSPCARPGYAGQLLDVGESTGILPQEVIVDKEEAYRSLQPVTSKLGIELRIDDLVALEEARASMDLFMRRH